MSFRRTLQATAIAMALQLHGSFLCHGFSLSNPSANTNVKSSQLNAHARRSHTYKTRQQHQRQQHVPAEMSQLMDEMDTNGNGQIDAVEWRNYLVTVTQGRYTDAVAKSIFQRLDTRGKGSLPLAQVARGIRDHDLLSPVTMTTTTTAHSMGSSNNANAVAASNTYAPPRTFTVKAKQPKRQQQNAYDNNDDKTSQQLYNQQAKRFFDAMNVRYDGFLSFQELSEHFLLQRMQQVARSTGLSSSLTTKQQQQRPDLVAWNLSETAIRNLFQMMDSNADGRISLEDLRHAFVRYPSVRQACQTS
jgi:Ca2+-binding EF-hand superfamily protein